MFVSITLLCNLASCVRVPQILLEQVEALVTVKKMLTLKNIHAQVTIARLRTFITANSGTKNTVK